MSRITRAAKIICRWNARKITGDEAMREIGKIFEKDWRPMWRDANVWDKKREGKTR